MKKTQTHILIRTDINAQIQHAIDADDFVIHTATSTDDLIQQFSALFPMLVIVDDIPTCAAIRPSISVPILVVTQPETIDDALAAGANDCISYPLHGSLLRSRITRMIGNTLAAYDDLPVMIHSINKTQQIIYANRHWFDTMGYEREEVLGHPITDFFSPTYQQRAPANIESFWQTGIWRDQKMQLRHKQGHIMDALLDANLIYDATGEPISITTIRDISLLESAEAELRNSQHEMQTILSAMRDAVIVLDAEGTYVSILTPNSEALLSDPEDLIGKNLKDIVSTQAEQLMGIIHTVLESGQTVQIEYDLTLKQQTRWFDATVSRLDGERVVWVVHDITERVASEATLRESEHRYRNLFATANDGILVVDIAEGMVIEANEQMARMLDYAQVELIGKHISEIEIAAEDDDDTDPGHTNQLIVESRYARRNGTIVPVETSSRIITYAGRPAIVSFARDITERKAAEKANQEQHQLAEALRDAAAAFNRAVGLDKVLDLILENSARMVPNVTSSNVALVRDNIAYIVRHQGYQEEGFDDKEIRNIKFNITETDTYRLAQEQQQPIVVPDVTHPPIHWISAATSPIVKSFITAPIILEGETIGFINLDSSIPNQFSKEHGIRLQAFANQAAIAIQNARLFDDVQNHADELEERVRQRTEALTKANDALRQQIIKRQETEDRLQEERTLLQTLIENVPDAIYIKDTQGRLLLANRASLNRLNASSLEDVLYSTTVDFQDNPEEAKQYFEREITLMRESKSLINQEASYVDSEGNKHWLLVNKVPLRDSSGNVIGLIGINRDITDLKEIQDELAQERNLLRTVLDTIPDAIYIKGTDHHFMMGNRALLESWGLTEFEELIGMSDDDLLNPDRAEETMRQEQTIIETGISIINEPQTFINESGEQTHLLITKLPLRDHQGNIIGTVGVNHDITELRRAEEQLEQVLTSARCLLWSANVIFDSSSGDYEWHVQIANEQAAQLFLPLDITSKTFTQAWLDSIVTEDRHRREYVFITHAEFEKHDYSQEFRVQLPDKAIHWLAEEVLIHPIEENRWQVVGVCTDITERKHAEEQLQRYNEELEFRVSERTQELTRSNETLKREISERKRAEDAEREQRILSDALRDSMTAINSSLDRDSVLESLLESMLKVVPHDAATVMLLESHDKAHVILARGYPNKMIGQDFEIGSWTNVQEVLQTRLPFIVEHTKYVFWPDPDGYGMHSNICVPIILEDEIIGLINVDSLQPYRYTREHAERLSAFANQASTAIRNARMVKEIRQHAALLERRVHERTSELEHERAQLRAILDAMRDGVFYQPGNLNAIPLYVNKALEEITGYTQDEYLAGITRRDISDRITDAARDELFSKIEHAFALQGYWEGESELTRKDGSRFDAHFSRTQVLNSDGQRLGIVTVLRDISQAKELEQQKARFIASASHELRTPIANMKTRLFLMKRRPENMEEHITIAESVVNLMQRLVETMFDISRFERGVIVLDTEQVDLPNLVQEVVTFHEVEAERKQINLNVKIHNPDLMIQADTYRMMQVLTNLISNALNYAPPQSEIHVIVDKMNDQAVVKVVDNGPGIAQDNLQHLFQPFFRAQEDNKGAGLGLSIAQEIVKSHGGEISVESTLGEGTCFSIYLPIND